MCVNKRVGLTQLGTAVGKMYGLLLFYPRDRVSCVYIRTVSIAFLTFCDLTYL